MKVSFSDLFFITLVEQNKNTGCNDIEIFGTWSHDLIDIHRNQSTIYLIKLIFNIDEINLWSRIKEK